MIDFGAIFRRAWEICWQNRWLFLLGILAALGSAGGGGNTSFSYSFGPGDVGPEFERQMEEFFRTLVAAWPYLLFGTIVLTLFGLLLWLLSLTARGGLIAAAAELDGETAAGSDAALGFGAAMRRGRRYLLRLVGLELLLYGPVFLLVVIPLAVLIASVVSAGIAAFDEPGALGGIVLVALTCLCLLGCLAILWQIFLAFLHPLAQRSLVLDDRRVIDAVRHGWQILSGRPGDMLVLVLLLFILGLIYGALVAVILVPLGLLLAVPTIFDFMRGGFPSGGQLVAIGIGAILLGLLGQVLRGFYVTYQSVAYTLAYRRLTGKAAGVVQEPPKPATPYQFEQSPEE